MLTSPDPKLLSGARARTARRASIYIPGGGNLPVKDYFHCEIQAASKTATDKETNAMDKHESAGILRDQTAKQAMDHTADANLAYRWKLRERRRIVVKVGSSSLLHAETGRLDYHKIDVLVRELSDLKNQGRDVILVTSGATAVGREVLRNTHSGDDLAEDSPITV